MGDNGSGRASSGKGGRARSRTSEVGDDVLHSLRGPGGGGPLVPRQDVLQEPEGLDLC